MTVESYFFSLLEISTTAREGQQNSGIQKCITGVVWSKFGMQVIYRHSTCVVIGNTLWLYRLRASGNCLNM